MVLPWLCLCAEEPSGALACYFFCTLHLAPRCILLVLPCLLWGDSLSFAAAVVAPPTPPPRPDLTAAHPRLDFHRGCPVLVAVVLLLAGMDCRYGVCFHGLFDVLSSSCGPGGLVHARLCRALVLVALVSRVLASSCGPSGLVPSVLGTPGTLGTPSVLGAPGAPGARHRTIPRVRLSAVRHRARRALDVLLLARPGVAVHGILGVRLSDVREVRHDLGPRSQLRSHRACAKSE